LVNLKSDAVISTAQTQVDRVRPFAVSLQHAGDFLNAILSSAVVTRLDNISLSIAVSLCLGTQVCALHTGVCGEEVNAAGTQGLVCRRSADRHTLYTSQKR